MKLPEETVMNALTIIKPKRICKNKYRYTTQLTELGKNTLTVKVFFVPRGLLIALERLQHRIDYLKSLLDRITNPRKRKCIERMIEILETVVERLERNIRRCRKLLATESKSIYVLPVADALRIVSRNFAVLHRSSEQKLCLTVSIHPDVNPNDISLTLNGTTYTSDYLHRVEYDFIPEPAPPSISEYPLWEFALPKESVAEFEPGDLVSADLNYLDCPTPVDSATPTYVQLDKVNALTLEPIRAVYIAPPEEWEDETSTFGVVVQSKGGVLNGRNLDRITVRSWSAPIVKPPPVDGELPPPPVDGKPRRELICETEVELKPYLHEPGLNKSETLMAAETGVEEPPMVFSPIVIPAVAGGVIECVMDEGITELYTVKGCKVTIVDVQGLHKTKEKDKKGSDNQGRIYTNRHPDGTIEMNVQYVVISVEVTSKEQLDLDKHFIRFTVTDPDDPSNIEAIDKNGDYGNDNFRERPESKSKFFFEKEDGYEIVSRVYKSRSKALEEEKKGIETFRERVCCKMKGRGKSDESFEYDSKVQLHVTDASGDNYKVLAELVERVKEKDEEGKEKWTEKKVDCGSDETGIMTVWRKVRVEIDVMKDVQGRNYLRKWLGDDWKKIIIEQLNESFNPKVFMGKAPPPNICYVEYEDAGNTTEIKNKEGIPLPILEAHLTKQLAKLVIKYCSAKVKERKHSDKVSASKAPDHIYVLAIGKDKKVAKGVMDEIGSHGVCVNERGVIVILVGNCETLMSRYAQGHMVPAVKAVNWYGKDKGFTVRLADTERDSRIRALIKKTFVHETAHMFGKGAERVGHDYLGEAIIKANYSPSLKELLKLPERAGKVRIYVGEGGTAMSGVKAGVAHPLLHKGKIICGDVMVGFYFQKVGKHDGWTLQEGPSSNRSAIFEYDAGVLSNLYFAPKRIRKIRNADNPLFK